MGEALTDPRRVRARLDAVTAVGQVVHAIWALARAQLPRVEMAAAETTTYLARIDELIERLAGPPGQTPERDVLHVVTGPERPYCGALARHIIEQLPQTGAVGLVGQHLVDAVAALPRLDARVVFRLSGAADVEEVPAVTYALASELLDHAGASQVELLHPAAGGSQLNRVVLWSGPRGTRPDPPESFTEPAIILEAALSEALRGHLAAALIEALRSEVRARIALAEAARAACDSRIEELDHARRMLRQEEITNELSELVAGRLADASL
jgi:F-type H+-transporting ATPase subunit gamma